MENHFNYLSALYGAHKHTVCTGTYRYNVNKTCAVYKFIVNKQFNNTSILM